MGLNFITVEELKEELVQPLGLDGEELLKQLESWGPPTWNIRQKMGRWMDAFYHRLNTNPKNDTVLLMCFLILLLDSFEEFIAHPKMREFFIYKHGCFFDSFKEKIDMIENLTLTKNNYRFKRGILMLRTRLDTLLNEYIKYHKHITIVFELEPVFPLKPIPTTTPNSPEITTINPAVEVIITPPLTPPKKSSFLPSWIWPW